MRLRRRAVPFALDQLPAEAVHTICQMASQSGSPAPCLLAMVCRSWGEAVRPVPLGVTLFLGKRPAAVCVAPCPSDIPARRALDTASAAPPEAAGAAAGAVDLASTVPRLESLAAWLAKDGHRLSFLHIDPMYSSPHPCHGRCNGLQAGAQLLARVTETPEDGHRLSFLHIDPMYSSLHPCNGRCDGLQACAQLLARITQTLAQGNLHQQQQQEEQQRQQQEWWDASMAAAAATATAAKEAAAAAAAAVLAQASAARAAAAAAGKVSRRSRAFKKAGLDTSTTPPPVVEAMSEVSSEQTLTTAAAAAAAAVTAGEGDASDPLSLLPLRPVKPAPPLGALTSLQLPALGAAPQQLLAAALAACPNLVKLHLSGATGCSWCHTKTTSEGWGPLGSALQRLGELQELTIDLDAAQRAYGKSIYFCNIKGLAKCLPASLQVLQLLSEHHECTLELDSIAHLVNLQHLELPERLILSGMAAEAAAALQQQHDGSQGSGEAVDDVSAREEKCLLALGTVTAQLAGLTALTSLYCRNALDKKCAALLCLPSLKVLQAGWSDGVCLAALQPSDAEECEDAGTAADSGKQRGRTRGLCSQLDTLALGLGGELKYASTKKALGALKHLKSLHLSLASTVGPDNHIMYDGGVLKAAAESLGNLPQLRHLDLPLPLLLKRDGTWLTALTSMTSLALNSQTVQPGHVLLEQQERHAARLADQKEKMKVAAKALAEHVPSLKKLELYNVVQPVSARAKPAAGVQRLLRGGVELSVVVEEEQ